jgi:hypothetical protein
MTTTPDHEGWTHEQEMAWDAQQHTQEVIRLEATKELDTLREQNHALLEGATRSYERIRRTRRWLIRAAIALPTLAVWLLQTGYVTYYAVRNPEVLTDIEKYILLIGVTGVVVAAILVKVWPDSDEGNGNSS